MQYFNKNMTYICTKFEILCLVTTTLRKEYLDWVYHSMLVLYFLLIQKKKCHSSTLLINISHRNLSIFKDNLQFLKSKIHYFGIETILYKVFAWAYCASLKMMQEALRCNFCNSFCDCFQKFSFVLQNFFPYAD